MVLGGPFPEDNRPRDPSPESQANGLECAAAGEESFLEDPANSEVDLEGTESLWLYAALSQT